MSIIHKRSPYYKHMTKMSTLCRRACISYEVIQGVIDHLMEVAKYDARDLKPIEECINHLDSYMEEYLSKHEEKFAIESLGIIKIRGSVYSMSSGLVDSENRVLGDVRVLRRRLESITKIIQTISRYSAVKTIQIDRETYCASINQILSAKAKLLQKYEEIWQFFKSRPFSSLLTGNDNAFLAYYTESKVQICQLHAMIRAGIAAQFAKIPTFLAAMNYLENIDNIDIPRLGQESRYLEMLHRLDNMQKNIFCEFLSSRNDPNQVG
ncbi:hypothetical protein Ciccas_006516 [Cichlidogyrus casuarinus]|uniref:Dynein heavy chain tail domain-containing protein n=1 Tax=Cichlidogyrus casuarinus TaxID=1844966 RepID=A0ABD2Q5J0_9PLAT